MVRPSMITQARLKELVSYDPLTGEFRRLASYWTSSIGKVAGGIHSQGYVYIRVDGTQYLAHRLAVLYVTGEWPTHEVDHINGRRADNRWENLRCVTKSKNQRNKKRYANNTSGVMGVHWVEHCQAWQARIQVCGSRRNLGLFDDPNDAIAARKRAEHSLGFGPTHGE